MDLWRGFNKDVPHCGRGGALVESTPFDRWVAGSNPALEITKGHWASPSLAVAHSASVCKLRHSVNCCGQERLWKTIEMDKCNTIQYNNWEMPMLSSLITLHSPYIFHKSISVLIANSAIHSFIHSFIHYGCFYSASWSALLLRDTTNYSIDTVSELTRQCATYYAEYIVLTLLVGR